MGSSYDVIDHSFDVIVLGPHDFYDAVPGACLIS
jgi:hypothetical protein